METDPIPNQDDNFDNEAYDELVTQRFPDLITYYAWLDIMQPIWINQIRNGNESGFYWRIPDA